MYYQTFKRQKTPVRSVYARSWKSFKREPIVKKSTTSFLRGLSIILFDDANQGTSLKWW